MGRTKGWLAQEREALIGIFAEMARGSSYSGKGGSQGDLSLMLACLARVTAGPNGTPRTLSAMRQAWWRWTTKGSNWAVPSVLEAALIVRHARFNGWLENLTRPESLALEERLIKEFKALLNSEQRELEVAWTPAIRIACEPLLDFLEHRISRRAEGAVHQLLIPNASVIQEEVSVMLTGIVRRMLFALSSPREIFEEPHDSDSFLQPFEGWPVAFRRLSTEISELLNTAADEYEKIEADAYENIAASDKSPRRGPRSDLKRKALFGKQPS